MAGVLFTCSIGITSGIVASTSQVIAQEKRGEMLIAQLVRDEDNDFQFESRGCYRTKPIEVACDVLMTNTGNTRQTVRFRNQGFGVPTTDAIDSSGTVYGTTLIRQGTDVATPNTYVEPNLAPGIPIKITFIFEIPREVTQLSALDLSYEPIPPNSSNGKLTRLAVPNIGVIDSKPGARL